MTQKELNAMVNKTAKHLDKMMKEIMDLKSPTMKKYIKMIQKNTEKIIRQT